MFFSSSMQYQAASLPMSLCLSSLRSWWVSLCYSCLVTKSTAYKQQTNQKFSAVFSYSTRVCILYHLCCSCAWACHWSIVPLWLRFWESCSSTSTTAGSTSYSWSARCPASSFFILPTSRHQRNTWPSDPLQCISTGWTLILNSGITRSLFFLFDVIIWTACSWIRNCWLLDASNGELIEHIRDRPLKVCSYEIKSIFRTTLLLGI